MACRIEIEKTINESINKQLPYRDAGMGYARAKQISDYLNDLWGNISVPVQHSGQGAWKVELNNIDKAVNREFAKQTAAEKTFEKSLDFFNGDVALYNQEQREMQDMSNLGALEGEYMATERGAIGVNKQQLMLLLGSTMYNKPLAQVAVKELLQNAFDAVKTIQNVKNINTPGNIDIDINAMERTISIKDDGIGMTPEIVKNAFLNIGGTNKEGLSAGERSGGLGLAKVQFLLGSESVKIVTVRDGIKTSIDATNAQLYNDDFDIHTESTNEPNGSFVQVKIPKEYTTMEGTVRQIDFPRYKGWRSYDILEKPLIGNTKVSATFIEPWKGDVVKETIPIGINSTEETLPPFFAKINFDWGEADLYMSTEKKEYPSHQILSSGIYQFNYNFKDQDWKSVPYDIVVNIKPSVISTSEQYPFNNQREGFKNTVSKDISMLNSFLLKYARGEAEKEAVDQFSDIKPLPRIDPDSIMTAEERQKIFAEMTDLDRQNRKRENVQQAPEFNYRNINISANKIVNVDTGEEIPTEKEYDASFKTDKVIEEVAPVNTEFFNPQYPQFHNNTNVNFLETPEAVEFFTDFGNVVLKMIRFAGDELGYEYKKLATNSQDKFFGGVSIDKTYGGVHIRKIINAIFVNPLAFDAQNLEEAVGVALHAIIHEINHTTAHGEGASFTTDLAKLYGKIYGTNKYAFYESLVRSVFRKHFETYKKLKYDYDKSSTRNLSKSFEGNEIKGPDKGNNEGNAPAVQAGQPTEERPGGDQQDLSGDKVGEIIHANAVRNQGQVMLHKEEGPVNTQASPKTIAMINDFLKRIGVDIKSLTNISLNGTVQTLESAALLTQKLIQVVEGKTDTELTEEAMHFAVAIIKQTNPALYKKLLSEISQYRILNDVFDTYGNDQFYQKDGKPDVIKLKEEAIGKVLAEVLIRKAEGLTETSQRLEKVNSWWDQIIQFFKTLFSKSGFDQAAMDIISGKDIGTAEDIREDQDSAFLHKDEQSMRYDKLKAMASRIELKGDSYYLDGEMIPRRVSDITKTWYEKISKNLTKSEYDKAVDDLKAEKGTVGHKAIDYAFHILVDDNGYVRETPEDDSDYEAKNPGFPRAYYEILKKNLKDRLESFTDASGKTRFLSEITVYNGKGLAGTIDFMAIRPDGKVNVLDWKFMNLNVEEGKYSDIPWYKINSWRAQMDQYKYILEKGYGILPEEFEQTRMIPIQANYSERNPRDKILPELIGVRIGAVNPKEIDEDYLLPVGIESERTGIDKVDKLIQKLNAIYTLLSEKKVLPSEKLAKNEQLNQLFSAIRQLQIKQNFKPLLIQAKLLNHQVQKILKRYNDTFKGKDAFSFTNDQIEDFAGELELAQESVSAYVTLYTDLKPLFADELSDTDKELKDDLRDTSEDARDLLDTLNTTLSEYTAEIIAKSEGIERFLSPEKVIKGITRWFSTTSTLQSKSVELLYKKANKAFMYIGQDALAEKEELLSLKTAYESWAAGKGLNKNNASYFSIIKKPNKNELIDEFQVEFYNQIQQKCREHDFNWIKDNIDVTEYNKFLAEHLQSELKRIDEKYIDTTTRKFIIDTQEMIDRRTDEVNRARALYNTSTAESPGWFIYDLVKKFPKTKWQSKEWIELNKPENTPAKAFYDYIVKKNREFADLDYISKNESRVFLPFVRRGLTENLVTGGNPKFGTEFFRNITVDESDVGYGQYDPQTGKPINVIPKYFTNKNEEDVSNDLFKSMGMYTEAAIRYKYLTKIEKQAIAIVATERNKQAISTSIFGKTVYDKNSGLIQYTNDNSENTKLVEDMMKAIIYDQRYIQSETFDQLLGKLGTWGETFNKKLGVKIFPENLSDKQVSVNKVVSQMNNMFQLNVLGVNILSAASNLFGGSMHSIINAGKYYTKTDYTAAELSVFVSKFNVPDKEKMIAALEYFLPLTDNYNREVVKRLSLNVATSEGIQDGLMWFMRQSDWAVQISNFYAYLKNTIVLDGKVLNVREYLRDQDKYKDMYSHTTEQRKALEEEFEEDVKKLIEEKGILKVAVIKDKKMVIPGVNQKDQSVVDLRRIVQQLSKNALGNLSEDDLRMINLSIQGKSFMIFKNWIPRLVDVRMGNMKYNSALDAYEWGRTRMIFRVLSGGIFKGIADLSNSLVANEKGVAYMKELFEKKKADYEHDTGKTLNMTLDEFIDLARGNIKNQLVDLIFLCTLLSLILALKAIPPDDDEDPAILAQYRFMLKATDKFKDELLYFYNPTSLQGLIGTGGIFPALGLVTNFSKGFSNFLKYNWALVEGNEQGMKDAHYMKYWMKSFPFTNQMVGYLPMVYPELAKDMGIRMQSNYGIR